MRNDILRRPDTRLYAVPFDGWSRELDEVLVEFCKRGRDGQRDAILAIQATHPEITSNIIWARIVYVGLSPLKDD